MVPLQTQGVWLVGPLAALLIVSAIDLRSRRIPNLWVGLLFLGGLTHAALQGAAGAVAALAGAALGFSLLVWQYSKGLMGAGDLKLLAAIGTWTGPLGAVVVFLVASVLGGIFSLVALASLGQAEKKAVGQNVLGLVLARGASVPQVTELSRARGIPFGVSLSAAAAFFLLRGVWS